MPFPSLSLPWLLALHHCLWSRIPRPTFILVGNLRLGKFLVRLAASGVQTLVETHSDHVVNGVRIAAAGEEILSPDAVAIHYLEGDGAVREIAMSPSGGLSDWPNGFFDQAEQDLAGLSRIRRRG